MKQSNHHRHVIYEMRRIGAYIRVTAMDTDTLTEISVGGPATATENQLKKLAYDKLIYTLKRKGIIEADA